MTIPKKYPKPGPPGSTREDIFDQTSDTFKRIAVTAEQVRLFVFQILKCLPEW